MDDKQETKPMGQMIQIHKARVRDYVGEMVRGTFCMLVNLFQRKTYGLRLLVQKYVP